jgi:hypothetical protein
LSAARIAVPDLVSNSYFPAIVAIVLDFLQRRGGLDIVHELIFPSHKAYLWAICALAARAPLARDV